MMCLQFKFMRNGEVINVIIMTVVNIGFIAIPRPPPPRSSPSSSANWLYDNRLVVHLDVRPSRYRQSVRHCDDDDYSVVMRKRSSQDEKIGL